MNHQFRYRQFTAGNPLANALVIVVGIIVISLSLALGFFVFLAIAGFVLVMAAVMAVRNWWFGNSFRAGRRPERTEAGKTQARPRIIEGEYREVSGDKGSEQRRET